MLDEAKREPNNPYIFPQQDGSGFLKWYYNEWKLFKKLANIGAQPYSLLREYARIGRYNALPRARILRKPASREIA